MLPVTEKGRLGGCNAESGMESLPVTDSPHRKWLLMVPCRTFWPHPCVCPCPVLAEKEEGRTKSHSLKFKSDVSQVPPRGDLLSSAGVWLRAASLQQVSSVQASLKSICSTVASPSCCPAPSDSGERINYPRPWLLQPVPQPRLRNCT